jgi:hypothetical protein
MSANGLYRLKNSHVKSVHDLRQWEQIGFRMDQLERVVVTAVVEPLDQSKRPFPQQAIDDLPDGAAILGWGNTFAIPDSGCFEGWGWFEVKRWTDSPYFNGSSSLILYAAPADSEVAMINGKGAAK